MSPYRESPDRPLGESWLRWAVRWIFRGAIGVTWTALVIGVGVGAVFGICYVMAHVEPSCVERVTTVGAFQENCEDGQRLHLQIDPTNNKRTLAVCECVRRNAAPGDSTEERQ